jgi:hypothetical protein
MLQRSPRQWIGIAWAFGLLLCIAGSIAWGERTGYPSGVLGPVLAWFGIGGIWSSIAMRTDRERLAMPLSLLVVTEVLHLPEWFPKACICALGAGMAVFGIWVTAQGL